MARAPCCRRGSEPTAPDACRRTVRREPQGRPPGTLTGTFRFVTSPRTKLDLRSHRLARRSRHLRRRRLGRGRAIRWPSVVPRRPRQTPGPVHRGDRAAVSGHPRRPGRRAVRVRRAAGPHLPRHPVEQRRGPGRRRRVDRVADRRRGLRSPTRDRRPAGAVRGGADGLGGRRRAHRNGRGRPRCHRRWRRPGGRRRRRDAPGNRPRQPCARPATARPARSASRSPRTSRTRSRRIQPGCRRASRRPTARRRSSPTSRRPTWARATGRSPSSPAGTRIREVATALRTLLPSDDVFEAGQAASGLARQGDITDLPALVALIHRMSPADGGTLEAMCAVLPPGLDLARIAVPSPSMGSRHASATGAVACRRERDRGRPRRTARSRPCSTPRS